MTCDTHRRQRAHDHVRRLGRSVDKGYGRNITDTRVSLSERVSHTILGSIRFSNQVPVGFTALKELHNEIKQSAQTSLFLALLSPGSVFLKRFLKHKYTHTSRSSYGAHGR